MGVLKGIVAAGLAVCVVASVRGADAASVSAETGRTFVPVCVSASHIAFGSIRMEPIFFALGQVVSPEDSSNFPKQ